MESYSTGDVTEEKTTTPDTNVLEVSPSTSSGVGPLARISAGARELAAASISANTRAAYQGQLQRLYDYLDGQPLTDDTLAEYLTSLHDVGKSPAVAGQLVAAVRFQSKTTGQPSPVGPVSQAVLAGLRRRGKGRGRGQVKGIRWRDADIMAALAANGNDSLAGLRDASIIATMSDAMLRVSELCALVVEDVTFEPDGSARLIIRSSKSDPEGKGAVQYLGPPHREKNPGLARKGRILHRAPVSPCTPGGGPWETSAYGFGAPASVETPRRRRRYRGPGFWPQPPGGIGSESRGTRGHEHRDADRRPVVVASDAGPLRPVRNWPARAPWPASGMEPEHWPRDYSDAKRAEMCRGAIVRTPIPP